MSAPYKPSAAEVDDAYNADTIRWEYDQAHIDVSEIGDPPGSRLPYIVIRRRIVGQWETYTPDD